jgi:hypothetical protein
MHRMLKCSGLENEANAWAFGSFLAGIAVSNPPGDIDVGVVGALYADHLSSEVLPSVICLTVILKPRH